MTTRAGLMNRSGKHPRSGHSGILAGRRCSAEPAATELTLCLGALSRRRPSHRGAEQVDETASRPLPLEGQRQ